MPAPAKPLALHPPGHTQGAMPAGLPRAPRAQLRLPLAWRCVAALGVLCAPALRAFNLDVDKLTVYSGPEGSYFGYAVDFHLPAARA